LRDIAAFKDENKNCVLDHRPITPDHAASNVYLVDVQDFAAINGRKSEIDP
jgi:hypothetical protein